MNWRVIDMMIIVMILCGTSCKTIMVAPIVAVDMESSKNSLVDLFIGKQRIFNKLEIRASVRMEDDEENFNLGLTIRMEIGHVIWASVRSTIGIEIARVKATPDSIWLLSKLMQIQEKGDWKLVETYLGVPLDFVTVESILSRNPISKNKGSYRLIPSNESEKSALFYVARNNGNGAGDIDNNAVYQVNKNVFMIDQLNIRDELSTWKAIVQYGGDGIQYIDRITSEGFSDQSNFKAVLNYLSFEEKEELSFPFQNF